MFAAECRRAGRRGLEPVSAKNSVHRRGRNRYLMIRLQITSNPLRSEVVLLRQIKNLANHIRWRRIQRATRSTRPFAQPDPPVFLITSLPLVEGLPRNPEVSPRWRNILCCVSSVPGNFHPRSRKPNLLCVRYPTLLLEASRREEPSCHPCSGISHEWGNRRDRDSHREHHWTPAKCLMNHSLLVSEFF